jgi:hypothetical protein
VFSVRISYRIQFPSPARHSGSLTEGPRDGAMHGRDSTIPNINATTIRERNLLTLYSAKSPVANQPPSWIALGGFGGSALSGTWNTTVLKLPCVAGVSLRCSFGMPTKKFPNIVSAYTRPCQVKKKKNAIRSIRSAWVIAQNKERA